MVSIMLPVVVSMFCKATGIAMIARFFRNCFHAKRVFVFMVFSPQNSKIRPANPAVPLVNQYTVFRDKLQSLFRRISLFFITIPTCFQPF